MCGRAPTAIGRRISRSRWWLSIGRKSASVQVAAASPAKELGKSHFRKPLTARLTA